MKSVEQSHGEVIESQADRECYRCDRNEEPSHLFEITVEPSAAISGRYRESVRYCCVDCAAGMNLSEFSEGWKGRGEQR
nr:hypothetical protein [Halovivax limisalsi]